MKIIRDYLDLLNPFRELPFLHPSFSVKTFHRFFELSRLYEDKDRAREWLTFCLPIWNQIKWFEWPAEGVCLEDEGTDPDSLEECISRYGNLHKRTWAMKERLTPSLATLQSVYHEKIECLGVDHSSVDETKRLLLALYEPGSVETEFLKRITLLPGTEMETWTMQYKRARDFSMEGSKDVLGAIRECYNAMTERKVPFDHPLYVNVAYLYSSTLMSYGHNSEAKVIEANVREEKFVIPQLFLSSFESTFFDFPWNIEGVEEKTNDDDLFDKFRFLFPGIYDRLFFNMHDLEEELESIYTSVGIVKVNNRYYPVLEIGITGETSEKFKKIHLCSKREVMHLKFIEVCSFMDC